MNKLIRFGLWAGALTAAGLGLWNALRESPGERKSRELLSKREPGGPLTRCPRCGEPAKTHEYSCPACGEALDGAV